MTLKKRIKKMILIAAIIAATPTIAAYSNGLYYYSTEERQADRLDSFLNQVQQERQEDRRVREERRAVQEIINPGSTYPSYRPRYINSYYP